MGASVTAEAGRNVTAGTFASPTRHASPLIKANSSGADEWRLPGFKPQGGSRMNGCRHSGFNRTSAAFVRGAPELHRTPPAKPPLSDAWDRVAR